MASQEGYTHVVVQGGGSEHAQQWMEHSGSQPTDLIGPGDTGCGW